MFSLVNLFLIIFDGTPATYKYWDVKDKSKLIICSISLDRVNYIFPELEYKFDNHFLLLCTIKIKKLIFFVISS